jgi:hypothetical protein
MIDKYLKLGTSTALEYLEYYCAGIIEYFGVKFLRRPTQRLLTKTEERGFSGMIWSIDYMHGQWHNYLAYFFESLVPTTISMC